MTVEIVIGAAVLLALLVADFLLYRLVSRALFWLVDLLPPYRPGGRYHSQATPEMYASLRRPRKGS
ncbi:hypothetical protein [Sphingomonas sp.]|jgi:hypothetical protein|uniref:hypothetical protein n=1 Tax=Sphingomonas sp. TaxID=28214 RepID=UPI002D8058A8|nr:hypothetical protein [Sphingomonas sp.]HEU0043078.1 hypothetical protein [Sphingomonas sp.]